MQVLLLLLLIALVPGPKGKRNNLTTVLDVRHPCKGGPKANSQDFGTFQPTASKK